MARKNLLQNSASENAFDNALSVFHFEATNNKHMLGFSYTVQFIQNLQKKNRPC